MSRVEALLADDATRRRLAAGLSAPANAAARDLASYIADAAGAAAVALIHYGSHAQRSDARADSAWDFFLVVTNYRDAYDSLRRSVGTSYHPLVARLLNRVLPPNVVAITRPGPPPALAKVAVMSLGHLRRAASARARDHFVRGRLFQCVQVAWARDDAARRAMIDVMTEVRARTIEWGAPSLAATFDADEYCASLLRRSYEAEIRPEHPDRVQAVLESQRSQLVPAYDALLQALERLGVVTADAGRYRLARPPSAWERARARLWFARSKVRATARWLKYVALYEGWTEYIAHKVARRTGMSVELTDRQRRHPLLFGWPWLWRLLIARSRARPR